MARLVNVAWRCRALFPHDQRPQIALSNLEANPDDDTLTADLLNPLLS